MQKQFLGALAVTLLALTPAPAQARTPDPVLFMAQAGDSVEVDAAEAKLYQELEDLRAQLASMKQQVSALGKKLDAMTATAEAMSDTMTKMKKGNRKG